MEDPRIARFFSLLSQNVDYNHDVAFYAYQLKLHPDSLSRLLRRGTGYGAKWHISRQLYEHADKRLRDGQQQSTISRELGFVDAAHFSRFIKKMRGSGGPATRS